MTSGIVATQKSGALGLWARHRARLRSYLTLTAVGLIPVVLLLPFVNAPFERDEAVYAVVADGLLEGALPYRDLFDHKPPLVHLWYALSFTAFGEHVAAPRILAMLFFVGSTLAVFAYANLLFSRRVAFAAALTMGATAGLVMLKAAANAEVFTIFPGILALIAATQGMRVASEQRGGAWRWFALAGVLSGVAVLTKQVVLLPTLAIGVVLLWTSRSRIRDVGAFVAGGLLVLLAGSRPVKWCKSAILGVVYRAAGNSNSSLLVSSAGTAGSGVSIVM